MKVLSKTFIPLFLALMGLGIVVFMLPFGADARHSEPNSGDIPLEPQTLSPGAEVQLSNANGSVPAIAASDSGLSAAVVYVLNSNEIHLRWAQELTWSNDIRIDSNNGREPKIAYKKTNTDTVHIVWSGNTAAGAFKAIRHRRCTMTTLDNITCGAITDIASTASALTSLRAPDIVVDSNGRLHVAWFEFVALANSPVIKTVISVNADDGTSWGGITNVSVDTGSDGPRQPTLAASGSLVHLAFRDWDGVSNWQIEYLQSGIGGATHSWGSPPTSGGPFDEQVQSHNEVANPTIAAGSSKVFMAWDIQNSITSNLFGLVGGTNTNSGNPANWDDTQDITGTFVVSSTVAPNDRRSQDGGIPNDVEDQLQPRVALTGTNDFVIVWHERHDQDCPIGGGISTGSHLGENGTSEIYYAELQSNGWALVDTVANNPNEYSIDPDIAIDSQGRRHIVYMKATSIKSGSLCGEGGASLSDYAIYYHGEIVNVLSDSNDVYLPIITKK